MEKYDVPYLIGVVSDTANSSKKEAVIEEMRGYVEKLNVYY